MKPALAQAYDRLMDRTGTTALLAALAETGPGRTLPITDLLEAVSALGGPSRLGPLRDQLMALQPLLLRLDPGTDEEQVGFRHPEIAARARARRSDAGVTAGTIHTTPSPTCGYSSTAKRRPSPRCENTSRNALPAWRHSPGSNGSS